jgi:DNA gyrase/topoisomerase IV subunit B
MVNDKTRRLEQLSTDDLNETLKVFNAMMGNNLELRKILIRTGGKYE